MNNILTNTALNDRSRLKITIKLLPEEFVDQLVKRLLRASYYPKKFNRILEEYNSYSKRTLSEFSNPKINKAWKTLNKSFYTLRKFFHTNFQIPEEERGMDDFPTFLYLRPDIHRDFSKQDEANFKLWDECKNKLDDLAKEFEKTYKNFINIAKKEFDEALPLKSGGPTLITHGNKGYLKFGENDKETEISKITSQPFKLLQSLTEPQIGSAKSTDTVFEAIRENVQDGKKTGTFDTAMDRRQKIRCIKYVIKDLQKDNKLQGKITFKWAKLKDKLWIEYNS